METSRRKFLQGSSTIATAGMMLGLASGKAQAAQRKPSLDPSDWKSVRAQFNLDPKLAHLANFFLASYPAPVREAIEHYRDALNANPYSYLDDHMFMKDRDMLWRDVAQATAEYVGGKPDEIALTASTTWGLSLIYSGLQLRPGQEILTTTHEFYAHHESIRLAADKTGTKVRKVTLYDTSAKASADEMVNRLISAIRPETRVVGVTWVHSGTGVVLPIRAVGEALAKVNRNRDDSDRVLLVVDGVHGFGVLDEDIARQGSDFFSAGTHKWILGPHGTGMVWGRNESWALLKPTVPSLMASELMAAWREGHPPEGPVTAARISPGGFFAYEHQWAVTAAYGFHKSLGRTRITNRILDLNGWLIEGLSKMKHVTMHTPSKRDLHAGFVCFEVDQISTEEVGARLRSKGIIASPSPYANPSVRFAAGIVNSEADIERALKAVRSLA